MPAPAGTKRVKVRNSNDSRIYFHEKCAILIRIFFLSVNSFTFIMESPDNSRSQVPGDRPRPANRKKRVKGKSVYRPFGMYLDEIEGPTAYSI